MQRERKPNSSAVTIDLDIAFYENKIMEYVLNRSPMGKHFVVPHPETHKEAHVIIPLADVTPNFVHPLKKKSLREIAKDISGKDDFCSLFSTVQDKGFLQMIDGSVEHSHEQEDSCKMNPRFKGEYQMSDGEPLFNKMTLETGKPPTESNTNAAMLNEDLLTDLIKPSSTNTSLANASDLQNIPCFADPVSSDSIDRFKGSIPNRIEKPLTTEIHPVALVTGAARRIGASIIKKLHDGGYNVVVHYNKSETDANKLVQKLNR